MTNYKSATCPNCNVELEIDEPDDWQNTYDENQSILMCVCGHCPQCSKNYIWDIVYVPTEIKDFEEN